MPLKLVWLTLISDFRKVCVLKPKDKDARAKLNACEKVIKQEAFAKAIMSEKTAPLSETYDPSKLNLESGYDGPNPIVGGPTSDMELEASMFEPGNLPRAFVLVRVVCLISESWTGLP